MQNFNYHTHTYRCGHSDQGMQDEDYIKEAIKMGLKKIAFTDHMPEKNRIDKRQNMRMDYSQKDEYLNRINELKEKYEGKIEIETGFEAEYLPGDEENLFDLKRDSDKIVLGQHFIYDDNKNLKIFQVHEFTDEELIRYAKYIDKAMELGIPDIIAHPDLYMKKRKEFGEIEEKVCKMICESAEKYNVPLEINLCNIFHRTYFENDILNNNNSIEEQKKKLTKVIYPCRNFWKIASNYNIKVLYGIDAHYRGQILLFKELVELANEIIGEEIINRLNFTNLE